MTKKGSIFFCQNCGTSSTKWLGKCPSCSEWNTFVEEKISKKDSKKDSFKSTKINTSKLLKNINYSSEKRIISNDKELNRVLGGGIVPGSIILLGGDPGIGKSTLLLQFALSSKSKKILYVSGEESERQIKMRAERINKVTFEERASRGIIDNTLAKNELYAEEAIAEMYRARGFRSPLPPRAEGIYNKIVEFFKELGNSALISGYSNIERSPMSLVSLFWFAQAINRNNINKVFFI